MRLIFKICLIVLVLADFFFRYIFRKREKPNPKPLDNREDDHHNHDPWKTHSAPLYTHQPPPVDRSSPSPTEVFKDIKDLIEKDIVPGVLRSPLIPQSYQNFFASLLYAEEFYIQKWSKFQLVNVNLKLHQPEPAIHFHSKSNKKKNVNKKRDPKDEEETFVAIQVGTVHERWPLLLLQDFVFVQPSSGSKVKPFQGVINRVVKSNLILVKFGDEFYHQHSLDRKYNVSFSFNRVPYNRVSLERCHQAIASVSHRLLENFVFPDHISRTSSLISPSILSYTENLNSEQKSAVNQILRLKGPPPYLIKGPISVTGNNQLSKTGLVVAEAVLQIYRTVPKCRILICAPLNCTCDVLTRNLKKGIPESKMFRANAAFRELDDVPNDILSSCLHQGDCFTCPPLEQLENFKVILSTFISSARLMNKGLKSGHFSHIFLVDSSSAIEPEIMVTLAHLGTNETTVVVTGAPNNHPARVRSDIARTNGLMVSYFERLCKSKCYSSLDPKLCSELA